MKAVRKLGILLLLALPLAVGAQTGYRLSGKVTNAKTGEKIEMAAIQLRELNRWTTSDENGDFSFREIAAGTYTLEASCLGYDRYAVAVTINRDVSEFKLLMDALSLGLEEVVVTARENTSLSSSSRIESTALEHVQPTGLADVMQLVPGQITLNPDMSRSNQIAIRDINTTSNPDAVSAMGTAIIIDGTPMNNAANLQTLNTAGGGTSQGYSTAGQGIDLRQVSTDNIESVEVIRGIPSVQYGDLTTGAVLVKTKAGKTKLEAKIKADPNIKQAGISKGFLLPGGNAGAVNADLDYSHAYDDIRVPTRSYRRMTGQLGYSNTFFRGRTPLSFNTKLSYYSTFDNNKTDPDMLKEEIYKNKEQSLGFKLYGSWSLEKPWLTGIEYNFSGNYEKQDYYEYKVTSGGTTPMPVAMVSGEAEGAILPSSYFSELTIDGKPYNYFGSLRANITGRYGRLDNHLMAGGEWRSSGNNGEGKLYDLTRPPTGAVSTRPRAFKDIPPSHELSLYAEDKVTVPLGGTRLLAQAGLRYTNLLPAGLFSTDGYTSLEPRINVSWDLLRKRKSYNLTDLSVRFGYGKTSKTPGMIFLYPDKAYEDELSFNYYPDLIVITTKVIEDTSNPALKPTTNTKLEAGLDFTLFGKQVMITGFMEKIIDGFSWESSYLIMDFRKWEALEGAGKQPRFSDGVITYTENGNVKTLGYTQEKKFESFQTPVNDYEIRKKGIEYVVNLGRIPAISSSLSIDGAYYHVARIDKVGPFSEMINLSYLGGRYPYLPVYPGNKGTVKQRLNSNIKLNTHIPVLKMVTSVTGMIIWFEKTNYYWMDEEGNHRAYSVGSGNQKLYGQFTGVEKIYTDPEGYYDMEMAYHPWQEEMSFASPQSFMVKHEKYNQYDPELLPFIWQINLKLSKEIGDKAKFSFFANNLFNYRPLHKYKRSDSWARRNQSAYFGAELKFTL